MSALSSFGWQMQADREDLCSRLVCKVLPVQVDPLLHLRYKGLQLARDWCNFSVGLQAEDSNHGLAMDYCLQNLEQHRFGDVDPASVESLYGG